VESLGEFGTPRGVDEIARIAKTHPVEEIRREAIETLEDIDGQSALAALRDLAALHPEADVRRRSIEALFEKGALATASAQSNNS
jgi:HEAT repeat protein